MTAVQVLSALERANEVRIARAVWCREVRASGPYEAARTISDVLRRLHTTRGADVELLGRVLVRDLLAVIPRLGSSRIDRLARTAGVHRLTSSHTLQLQKLTEHEATCIADALDLVFALSSRDTTAATDAASNHAPTGANVRNSPRVAEERTPDHG